MVNNENKGKLSAIKIHIAGWDLKVQPLQRNLAKGETQFIREKVNHLNDQPTLPCFEAAVKEAKRPQAAAFAPDVCESASAISIRPPAETPLIKLNIFQLV